MRRNNFFDDFWDKQVWSSSWIIKVCLCDKKMTLINFIICSCETKTFKSSLSYWVNLCVCWFYVLYLMRETSINVVITHILIYVYLCWAFVWRNVHFAWAYFRLGFISVSICLRVKCVDVYNVSSFVFWYTKISKIMSFLHPLKSVKQVNVPWQ